MQDVVIDAQRIDAAVTDKLVAAINDARSAPLDRAVVVHAVTVWLQAIADGMVDDLGWHTNADPTFGDVLARVTRGEM